MAPDDKHHHHPGPARARAEGTHSGACFCGAVRIEVTGEPAAMGYCHCESCRSWSASPVNAFSLWKPASVRVVQCADDVETFHRTPRSFRQWCRRCGGHLMTGHPHWDLVDVYAATIPAFPFHPALHVNYQEATLRIKDGLPKMKDLPSEMGGSGIVLTE